MKIKKAQLIAAALIIAVCLSAGCTLLYAVFFAIIKLFAFLMGVMF